jgi:hypothetical protein
MGGTDAIMPILFANVMLKPQLRKRANAQVSALAKGLVL